MSSVPSPARTQRPSIRYQPAALPILLGLVVAPYAASLRYGFVYDDFPQIVNNPRLVSWQSVPSYFTQHVWAQVSTSGTYYRPIFLLWLRLNHALFGVTSAFPWHLTTVLLHLVATALVFLLLQRTMASSFAAAIAALVFGLHPGHVESVAWISGCTEPLLTCALVGSLLCWLRREEDRGWYASALVLFVLALMVKETAVLLPGLIFLYAMAFERRTFSSAIKVVIPFAIIAALELFIRNRALHGGVPGDTHSLRETILTVPVAGLFYLRHLFWPVHLATFYDIFLTHEVQILAWSVCVLAIVVLAVIARTSREALVAVGWIVLPLLPALAGIRVFDTTDLVHDRYLYLSTIGLGMLVGLALLKLPRTGAEIFDIPAAPLAVGAVLTLAMLIGTTFEIQPWQSNLTLFVRAVQVAPHSPPAFNHLAFEMYKRGDVRSSHRLYEQALSLDPQDWPGTFGLAVLDMRTGNLAEADQYFQRAIELKPDVTNATYLLQSQVRIQAGRTADAERSVRRAIALWPGNSSQHLLLAQILLSERRTEEAKSEFERELQVDPNSTAAIAGLQSLSHP